MIVTIPKGGDPPAIVATAATPSASNSVDARSRSWVKPLIAHRRNSSDGGTIVVIIIAPAIAPPCHDQTAIAGMVVVVVDVASGVGGVLVLQNPLMDERTTRRTKHSEHGEKEHFQ
jgi:hypothetical protein